MKQLKLLLLAVIGLLYSVSMSAYDFKLDGMYYNITSATDKTVEVTSGSNNWDRNSINIPNTVNYSGEIYTVTRIGSSAFENCKNLTSVKISNSVTSIGGEAFKGCTGLTSVKISNSVTSIGGEAFKGCTGLTSVEIGNSVNSIGTDAFLDCSGLTSVHITDVSSWCKINFSNIFSSPMYYARNNLYLNGEIVTNLVIPNRVTSIGKWAFNCCTGLKSVVIPNSVTSIGEYAFHYCTGLKSVEIGNSVTSIGKYAFDHCTRLKSVMIPNSVTSIGNKAFQGCTSLNSVELNTDTVYSWFSEIESLSTLILGDKVKTIGNYAFTGCSGLTSVVIPNNLTNIEIGSFSGCSGLTTVEIGNSVTNIGEDAFSYCTGLKSVVIPNSVTSIGNKAFQGCTSLNSVELNTETVYSWFSEIESLSTLILGDKVKTINTGAFENCSGLTSVVIGRSVTSIGINAFSNCSNLTSIELDIETIDSWFKGIKSLSTLVLGDNVKSINKGAFEDCSGLTSLTIGNNVISIGNSAFAGCSGLTSIVIPNRVTYIGAEAFYSCTGLTSVEIGNSVDSIGTNAFLDCSGLTSVHITDVSSWCKIDFRNVLSSPLYYARNLYLNGEIVTNLVIPNRVTSIGKWAFNCCTSLKSVVIPNSVTSIGEYAFYYCTGLKSVVIPNSVTSIGEYAFYHCTRLKSVMIPNSITSIGNKAFEGCTSLNSVELNTETVYSWFSEIESLSTLILGDKVKTINTGAFENCSGLTSLTIGNNVISIGNSAFAGCSGLTSLDIPQSVTSIGDLAFADCLGLTSVTSYIPANNLFPIGSNVFESVNKTDCTLNVPFGAKKKYSSTTGWNEFKNIVELHFDGESVQIDEQGVMYILNTDTDAFEVVSCTDDLSTNIVLPATIDGLPVKIITAEVFKETNVQSIVIPATIQEVGDDAFVGCTELRWVDWQAQAQARAECFDAPEVHGNMLLFCYGEQAPDYAGNVVVNGKAKEIVLMDARPYASPYDYEAENISFTKTFTKETMIGTGAGWEGIVVPFDVEQIVFGDKVIAPFGATGQYSDIPCWLALMKDENFVMTDAIKADKAYIMAVPNSKAYDDDYNVEGDVRFEATNTVVKATANSATAPTNEHALVGTYEPVEIDADVFALNDDDYLDAEEDLVLAPGSVFVQGMREVRPFEAYVRSTKALQMACLKIGSVLPTHITSVQSGKTDAEAWYTLQGKRLNTKPVQTGFYLHGGKLEFVRQQ